MPCSQSPGTASKKATSSSCPSSVLDLDEPVSSQDPAFTKSAKREAKRTGRGREKTRNGPASLVCPPPRGLRGGLAVLMVRPGAGVTGKRGSEGSKCGRIDATGPHCRCVGPDRADYPGPGPSRVPRPRPMTWRASRAKLRARLNKLFPSPLKHLPAGLVPLLGDRDFHSNTGP